MQLLNFIIPQFCNLSIFQSYNLSSINNTLLLRQTRTQINRLINVVFFTFLFSLFSFSYGQVKIKEKVEIKPEVIKYKSLQKTSSDSHTIKLVLDWQQTYLGENHDIPMSRERFKINYPFCSGTFYSDYDYSGHLEYEFNALKGTDYSFTLLLSQRTLWDDNYNEDEPHGDTFLVYVDGEFVDSIRQTGFIRPWFGYYSIAILGNDITYDEQIRISDQRNTSCGQIIGDYEDDYGTISIESGNEYISFYNVDSTSEYIGDMFYTRDYYIEQNEDYPKIIYDTPYYGDNVRQAIIKGEVNNIIAYDTINIIPVSEASIKVDVLPNKIEPGDTADILLKQKNEDGTLEEFSNEQIFNINLAEGTEEYGTLLAVNGVDTSDSFTDTQQGVKFIAKKEISLDSVEVLINVNALIGSEEESVSESSSVDNNTSLGKRITDENSNSSNRKERIITPIDPGDGPQEISGTGRVVVKNNIIGILLGETKYLGVKKKGNKYKIAVTDTTFGVKPSWATLSDGWEWVKDSTVWSDNPIDVTAKGTSPIFYDKFFGVFSTTGTTRPVITNLPDGMLRIIGRYWEEENEENFKVKLKTTNITNTEIEVKVIKPNKLGNKNPTVVGPNNITWNLDSLIIETAGKTGILPQILKGIIEKESVGFHPSYRYEPFADMYKSGIRSIFDSTHTYWISSATNLGIPTIPQHKNLHLGNGDEINGYPGYKTVWDYYSEYDSSLFKTKFYPYQQRKYDGFYKVKIDSIKKVNKIDSTAAAPITTPLAVSRYQYYLKYEIGKKGMLNTIAQTRIAASYGLMQLTYYSGVNGFKNSLTIYNYPNNNENYLPESINIPDINIEWGTKHLLGKLREVLGNLKYLEEDTWPKDKAFEKMYWEALRSYNGGYDYPNGVFGFAKNYLPKK